MQEAPVTHELVVSKPQKGGEHRRIAEYDFSQVDFTKPEARQSIARATQILLSYRPRRLSEEPAE
jgi:hypothetical protein